MYIRVVSVQKLKILETKMKKGDWVINYHANYCGHCQQMKPEWERFVTKMKNNRNVNVADIESAMIPKMKTQPNIMGYPTIKFYHNNKDVAEHNGDRSCNGFEQFTKQNIGNNKQVAKPEPKKEYPTLGDTLGDVDSSSKPMNDILKLFSAKLDNVNTEKPKKAPVKSKKAKKSPAKAKKTKKAPAKAKKTKKAPVKKATTKAKKTKKPAPKPNKIKPIKPVLKDKGRKTTTEKEIQLHTNVQVMKTPQQIKAEKRREKRKQQRTKKRQQQQGKPKPERQNKIIKNLKESIANIKNQAAKDKKLLNELSK